jgi:hypothetical protein
MVGLAYDGRLVQMNSELHTLSRKLSHSVIYASKNDWQENKIR